MLYRHYLPTDLNGLRSLLRENQLPIEDIPSSDILFIVAVDKASIVGCIGLEAYNMDELLRSMAVKTSHQGLGIGGHLFQLLVSHSNATGIKRLHLLTTTAETYFLSRGFKVTPRDNTPDTILRTEEFSSLCPTEATYMVHVLPT